MSVKMLPRNVSCKATFIRNPFKAPIIPANARVHCMVFDDDNEEEGEDLKIDLSKIKNFFSKKKGKEPAAAKPQKARAADEPIKPLPTSPSQARTEIPPSQRSESMQKSHEHLQLATPEQAKSDSPIHSESTPPKPLDSAGLQPRESDEEISLDLTKVKGFFKGLGKRVKEPEREKEIQKKKGHSGKEKIKDIGEQQQPDEDFSIDLTKVKSIFSRFKEKTHHETEGEDMGMDIGSSLNFLRAHKGKIVPFLGILLPIILSILLRIQPVNLPITDRWAEETVFGSIKNQIRSQVDQQYPNLPEQNKAPIVQSEFARLRNSNKKALEQQINGQSQFFKSAFKDENGVTYLHEMDPYYWLRLTKNVIAHGHPGDELREIDGKLRPYDTFIFYPKGRHLPPDNFHAYFQAYLFKLVHLFNADAGVEVVAMYVPVLLSVLAIIPAFFIGRKLSGNLAGFVAAFVVALHPNFLMRTVAGFSDTDPYSLLFPLLIGWIYIEALSTASWKKRLVYAGISGFFLGFFTFAWGSGWWYSLQIIIVSQLIYLTFSLIKIVVNRKDAAHPESKTNTRSSLAILLFFLLAGAASTSLFTSFQTFKDGFIAGPMSFLTLKAALKPVGTATVWPNVFSTVEEQAAESIKETIKMVAMGSNALFLVALLGLLFLFLPVESKEKSNKYKLYFLGGSFLWYILVVAIAPKSSSLFIVAMLAPVGMHLLLNLRHAQENKLGISLLVAIWFAATVFASAQGARFSSLSASSVGIILGIGIAAIVSKGTKLLTPTVKLNPLILKGAFFLVIVLLFIAPMKISIAAAKNGVPFIDDTWYAALQKIDQFAAKGAVITSWWDFGHWFKAIGNRPATFDGTSQNTPNAYYVGKMLLEKNETLAVSLLRMVNCGQNSAHDTINRRYNDTPKTLDLLYRIIAISRNEAQATLIKEGFDEETTEEILSFTHCNPPESFFITSEDMVSKGFVWGHFGLWNFSRSLIYKTLREEGFRDNIEKAAEFLQGRFNITRKEAEDIFFEVESFSGSRQAETWIAPWPNYQGDIPCKERKNNSIICTQGGTAIFALNLTTLDTPGISTRQGIENPEGVIIPLEDGSYARRTFPSTFPASVMIKPQGNDRYTAFFMDSPHAGSLFAKLMFFDGHGLKHFEKFSDGLTIFGSRVIIWKVNWGGNATNKLGLWVPKQKQNSTLPINQTSGEEDADA